MIAAALAGLERFIIDDERGRRVEACQSPVWDTALAVVALADAGVERRRIRPSPRAGHWLLGEEVRVRATGRCAGPSSAPGGWAFEFANDNYPDIDDTAEVILALRRAGVRPGRDGDGGLSTAACAWTIGMQSRGGGWGAFDADNNSAAGRGPPVLRLRRGDRPPQRRRHRPRGRDAGRGAGHGAGGRSSGASTWLSDQQEADGSWFGRWGVNYVYGTGAAVPALVAAGVDPDDPRIRRAVAWLEGHQNADGGWGEDLRSYVDDGMAGPGRLDRVADRVGPAGPARGRRGDDQRRHPRRRRLAGRHPDRRTARGTSPGSPAPDSPGTSPSTTTCTAWCCRSWPWAATRRGRRDGTCRDGTCRHRAAAAGTGPAAVSRPGPWLGTYPASRSAAPARRRRLARTADLTFR